MQIWAIQQIIVDRQLSILKGLNQFFFNIRIYNYSKINELSFILEASCRSYPGKAALFVNLPCKLNSLRHGKMEETI